MKPTVVTWFKVYCAVLTFVYLLLIPGGLVYLLLDPATLQMEPLEAKLVGITFLVLAIPLAITSVLPFFLPPKPWVWVYSLVLICLGMTSCCFLLASVPLLLYWIKPETKAYYGK
jgi:hypothetical protein